jgi:superfamily II DNA or RNA helicase
MNNKDIKLRDYQARMVEATRNNNKGFLIAPTGSGKTFAQAAIAADAMSTPGFKVILVKTPRILLSDQGIYEFETYLSYNETQQFERDRVDVEGDYDMFLIHSGATREMIPDPFDIDKHIKNGLNEEEIEEERKAHTELQDQLLDAIPVAKSKDEIVERIENAKFQDIPVIIFTTYHSNVKAWDCISAADAVVDLDINDECHNLCSSGEGDNSFSKLFDPIAPVYVPKRWYGFTATIRTTNDIEDIEETPCNAIVGMENEDRFGPFNGGKGIFFMEIKEAILKGCILEAEPFKITSEKFISDDDCEEGLAELVETTMDDLVSNTKINAKLLVCTKGAKDIKKVASMVPNLQQKFGKIVERGAEANAFGTNLEILTVHSKKDCITHNGEQITRAEFETLKNKFGKDNSIQLIMFHCNILTEGIDIPGLTGLLILRGMELPPFLQSLGRVVRLYKDADGVVRNDLKPTGRVYFPDLGSQANTTKFTRMFEQMAADGFIPAHTLADADLKGDDGDPKTVRPFRFNLNRKKKATLDSLRVEKLMSVFARQNNTDLDGLTAQLLA